MEMPETGLPKICQEKGFVARCLQCMSIAVVTKVSWLLAMSMADGNA